MYVHKIHTYVYIYNLKEKRANCGSGDAVDDAGRGSCSKVLAGGGGGGV